MNEDKRYTKVPEIGKLEITQDAYYGGGKIEDARHKIAIYYVSGFILIVLYVLTLYWITKMSVDNLTELLIAISGIMSGPLGFIIGYYFKSNTD